MSGFVVHGASSSAPLDVSVQTFLDAGVHRFAPRGLRQRATEFVVHETVTRDVATSIRVLQRRDRSVHLVLGPDGALTQHGDLARDVLWHAGSVHNAPSFGVEVVTPYYPHLLRRGLPWTRTIVAPWAHRGAYVLPTPAQAEAVASLIRWATNAPAPGIEVPRRWIGVADGRLALGRVDAATRTSPGIYAHHYFGHADGAWLVLYAWLRLEADMPPFAAFEEAVRRAERARGFADLRDLISTPMA